MNETIIRPMRDDSCSKIKSSDVYASIFTKNFMDNPRCLIELGLAMILDKPICIIHCDDSKIPENIKKVAKFIMPGRTEDEMKLAAKALGADF